MRAARPRARSPGGARSRRAWSSSCASSSWSGPASQGESTPSATVRSITSASCTSVSGCSTARRASMSIRPSTKRSERRIDLAQRGRRRRHRLAGGSRQVGSGGQVLRHDGDEGGRCGHRATELVVGAAEGGGGVTEQRRGRFVVAAVECVDALLRPPVAGGQVGSRGGRCRGGTDEGQGGEHADGERDDPAPAGGPRAVGASRRGRTARPTRRCR